MPYNILVQRNPRLHDIPAFCQQGFFFNEGIHLCQQSTDCFYLITAVNQTTRQAEARCAFFVQSSQAISRAAAPFGSVEFTEMLPVAVLNEFILTLVATARQTGVSTLRLVNYPHCYAPQQAGRLTETLLSYGFTIVRTDPNHCIRVTNEPFEQHLHGSERRRLRKCQQAGFKFEHWHNPLVSEVVAFIETTRQQQGYQLTLSPKKLADLLQNFPEQFLVFVVKDGSTLATLTVAVRVRHDILYNFLPAYDPAYRTFSPMVILTDGLVTYCQQHGIGLLDLGISVDADRQPKPSLMRFKDNLGARSSPKMVFEKVL